MKKIYQHPEVTVIHCSDLLDPTTGGMSKNGGYDEFGKEDDFDLDDDSFNGHDMHDDMENEDTLMITKFQTLKKRVFED